MDVLILVKHYNHIYLTGRVSQLFILENQVAHSSRKHQTTSRTSLVLLIPSKKNLVPIFVTLSRIKYAVEEKIPTLIFSKFSLTKMGT